MSLRDKAVIVTGGASRIGLAPALRVAREGARLPVADLDRDRTNSAAMGKAADVADVILLSPPDAARFNPGANVRADGGRSNRL